MHSGAQSHASKYPQKVDTTGTSKSLQWGRVYDDSSKLKGANSKCKVKS